MVKPYLDANLLLDEEKERKSVEEFDKITHDYIENRFKGSDSESLYALFNQTQIDLLKRFYKGFSIEEYKALNGTVDLQIQEKNAKVKEKLSKISEFMGDINLKDWVYDGMVDAGSVSVKCDLCPRPVRYAHYAVNKKTKECLRFGCNCASDFFNIDKNSLSSMKTMEANMLKDIKLIGCIVEKNMFKEYYRYKGGYIGDLVLKDGKESLLELRSFMVKWDKDDNLIGDEEEDEYPITYGDGKTVDYKPLSWIKEHIISCMNGDLGGSEYDPISERDIIRKVANKDDKSQLNTMAYITYAVSFIEVGLPIPFTLIKKLNSIIQKVTHQHHPDKIKYLQELLIEHNFKNSSLLTKAFTEFMVNYLASSLKVEERDAELEYWGIRGQTTFYRTVLAWELTMHKMEEIKELYSLVSKNLITEDELNRFDRSSYVMYTKKLADYVKDAIDIFVSKKPVIRNDADLNNGFSKYSIKDKDTRIGLNISKEPKKYNLKFMADMIPYHVGLYYMVIEDSYKKLLNETIKPFYNFLGNIEYIDNEKDMAKYLTLLSTSSGGLTGITHKCMDTYAFKRTDKESFKCFLDTIYVKNNLDEVVYKKYKGQLKKLRNDLYNLYNVLIEILDGLKKKQNYKMTATQVSDDYDDLIVEQKKTNKDYFLDYCNLLVGKRGTKTMQKLLWSKNLNHLKAYKSLEGYTEIFDFIENEYEKGIKEDEEKEIYDEFKLEKLKRVIEKYINTSDLDTFIRYILFLYAYQNRETRDYILENSEYSKISNIYFDLSGLLVPLKDMTVQENLKNIIKEGTFKVCNEKYKEYFEGFFNKLKDLCDKLDKDKMSYLYYYKLLVNQEKGSEKRIQEMITKQVFAQYIINELGLNPYSSSKDFDISSLLKDLETYKDFEEYKTSNFMNEIVENLSVEFKEKELLNSCINDINIYLNEHIAFFEVDVEKERKANSYFQNKSDEAIRRNVAIQKVSYENSKDALLRFIENLEKSDCSSAELKVIEEAKALGYAEGYEYKKYAEVLRILMYNKKLIFNHFEFTHQLLLNLRSVDLHQFKSSELSILLEILKRYYLLKTDTAFIYKTLKNYNLINFDYNKYVKEIPEPQIVSVEDAINFFFDLPDSTGKTGVEKATEIIRNSEFNNLSDFLKKVVKTVSYKKFCDKFTLGYINMAYESLNLGKCDEVVIPEYFKGEKKSESVVDAENLFNHPNFETLPDYMKKIIKTVSTTKKCSSKQKYYIDKAKKELNI